MTVQFGRPVLHEGAAQQSLSARLLRARTPAEAVAAWFETDPQPDTHCACLLWSTHWPRDIEAFPDACADAKAISDAIDAVDLARAGGQREGHPRVLFDDGHGAVAVLNCAHAHLTPDSALVARLGELLEQRRMRERVARLEQAEKLQRSLYAIADMAGSDLEMTEMLRGLHRIVADLMYAENFYIALYDRDRDALRFLYFADVVDEMEIATGQEMPLSRIERGLTWYLSLIHI